MRQNGIAYVEVQTTMRYAPQGLEETVMPVSPIHFLHPRQYLAESLVEGFDRVVGLV